MLIEGGIIRKRAKEGEDMQFFLRVNKKLEKLHAKCIEPQSEYVKYNIFNDFQSFPT